MTWIKVTVVPEAEGPLRDAYNEVTSELSRAERETIVVAVSVVNKRHY